MGNLSIHQKRKLLEGIFSLRKGVTKDTKLKLLEKIVGNDKSDKSISTKLFCMTSLPELK